jgi:hypothetical protein
MYLYSEAKRFIARFTFNNQSSIRIQEKQKKLRYYKYLYFLFILTVVRHE